MGIGAEREADLTVPENFLHDPRRHTLSHEQGRATVPEVVKPLPRQSSRYESRLKAMRDVASVEGSPERRREHETPFDPPRSGHPSQLSDSCLLFAERRDRLRGPRESPPAPATLGSANCHASLMFSTACRSVKVPVSRRRRM